MLALSALIDQLRATLCNEPAGDAAICHGKAIPAAQGLAVEAALKDARSQPSRIPGNAVPACRALPLDCDALPDPWRAVLNETWDSLAWRSPGHGTLPDDVVSRMAVVEVLGPSGMVHS